MYVKFNGTPTEYRVLHYWVERQLGRPSQCVDCGTTKPKMFHWANISGEYRRDTTDWERLCASCHLLKDRANMCRKKLHELTSDNVYVHHGSNRVCRECKRQARKDYYLRYNK